MEKTKLEQGQLLQYNPEHDPYGGQIVMVVDPKEWGCQGILYLDREFEGLTRFQGRAFVRTKFEDVEPIGRIEWLWQSEELDEK